MAAAKGFGDPKKEQAKPQQAQQQQAAPQQQPEPAAPAPARRAVVRETPQVVVDRMFRRILVFTGVPVFTGMALFPLFYYLRVVMDIEYPLWIVYVSQVLTFGGGLFGITYGALSASWDPTREGSAMGWSEMQANLSILLNRNKQ
ncbi:hypothetical protein HYH02_009832 [Chlamydomonas schloesseri]|uniref:Protein PAM68, chloroplastic n=1 Tax=Chlamydomonas schloesseri TaxID=2026947 RepID=A0A835TQ73_9CHLO|nr:hypothetical protein HYH02_009832 [Chlamydomonas schloesseri]|eukprot:KAG2442040.1 hypothetical protein HYH02_009832 [Chlamydomonas schloesseri]